MRETQFHSSSFVMHTFGDCANGIHGGTVFWNGTQCSLVDIYRHLGRTCCMYLQALRNIGRHLIDIYTASNPEGQQH